MLQYFQGVRHQKLGRRRRGGGAYIGDKVGNGEVNLVANGADNRQRAGKNGARYSLIVKGPQIFNRAAATGENQSVEAAAVFSLPQRLYNCLGACSP